MSDAAIRRVLVIATRQIGDVLLTTPLIRAARERWPEATIDVLGFKGTLGMLRGNADVSALVEVESGAGWRAALGLLRRLWRRYDLALITQHSDRAHLYGWVAARRRSGLIDAAHRSSAWKRRLLAHAVPIAGDRGTLHTVAEKLQLLAPWSAMPARVDVRSPAAAALPPELEAVLERAPVVVHVPSMWRYKQWPLEHYRELIAALLADGHQVALTGSGSAVDREQVGAMLPLGHAPQLLDLAGRLDFNQLATLLQRAALYVGPDTSVTHLAAAAGVPIVTLFGPTNPLRWGPWPQGSAPGEAWQRRSDTQRRGRIVLLQGPGDCVPCGRAGCEDHHASRSDCLIGIDARRAIDAARELLRERSPSAPALEAAGKYG